MRIDEIEARKAEIRTIVNGDGEFDVDALTEEVRALDAEKLELEQRASKEAELRSAVADSVIVEIKESEQKEERKMENIITRNSPEYIEAFARYIKTGSDKEVRSLLTENASGTVAIPELVENVVRTAWDEEGIMALVKKSFIKGNLKVQFEISASGAVVHTEGGEGVSEETLVLGIVNLVPETLKKWVGVSDEVLDLAGEAFLTYVYNEVAHQIAKKAADELIAKINACGTASTTTCPAVPAITEASIGMSTIAKAYAELSDQAANPVIMMNRATYANFKTVQYANGYGADPFEGMKVVFNNTIASFSAATTGVTYAIVGDLGYGAIANFPNGEGIQFKFDDLTAATSDIVKVIGRLPVALGVVAPKAFCKIKK